MTISLSFDGTVFTSVPYEISYYAEPVLTAVEPISAAVSGGTSVLLKAAAVRVRVRVRAHPNPNPNPNPNPSPSPSPNPYPYPYPYPNPSPNLYQLDINGISVVIAGSYYPG